MVSFSTTNYSFCKDLIMLSASLYSFSSTYVTGLRHLTNVLLKKQIQNSLEGHCSTEDAEAALSLATSRAKLGNAFQLRENSRGKSLMRTFQTINRESTDDQKDNFAQRSTGPCVCIGSNEWISKYAKSDGSQHVLSCESIMSSMVSSAFVIMFNLGTTINSLLHNT